MQAPFYNGGEEWNIVDRSEPRIGGGRGPDVTVTTRTRLPTIPHGDRTSPSCRRSGSSLCVVCRVLCAMNMVETDSNAKLIGLIEERPVLWDRTIDQYKDRLKTKEAWYDICTALDEDYENKSDAERKQFCTFSIILLFYRHYLIVLFLLYYVYISTKVMLTRGTL